MKGRVCRLQLLQDLAKVVIIGFESRGNHDHILLSLSRDSTNLESQIRVFTFPGIGGPVFRGYQHNSEL
jgi:hypothetical protein